MIETSYRQLLQKQKHIISQPNMNTCLKRKQQNPLGFQTPPKNVFGPQQHTIQTPTPGDMTGRLGKVSVNPAAVEKETTKKMVGPPPRESTLPSILPIEFPRPLESPNVVDGPGPSRKAWRNQNDERETFVFLG